MVIGILIISGLFILITSIKISHLISMSITFGFWQIIAVFSTLDIQWPWVVDTTLSAASTTNFNVRPHTNFNLIEILFSLTF